MTQNIPPLYTFLKPVFRWLFIILPVLFLTVGSVFAQTNWDGSEDTDWNNPDNWSAGIPDADDDVLIPAVTQQPIITSGIAGAARSVFVELASSLTIDAGGTLTISGFAGYTAPFTFTAALNNLGTIDNSGAVIVGAMATAGDYGIVNQGLFSNRTGGSVVVDRTENTAIYNAGGIFTNVAVISLGANAAIGFHGIWNDAIFNNNAGGSISIGNSILRALVNNADESKAIHATFNNAAAITLGAAAAVGTVGIRNLASFNNNAGGDIRIDQATDIGLWNSAGTFRNAATIAIGGASSTGTHGLTNEGVFENEGTGTVRIDRSTGSALFHASGTFTNAADIIIGSLAPVGATGIESQATFGNTGRIHIDRTTEIALNTPNGTFTNERDITIGMAGVIGVYGIVNRSTFTNSGQGYIRIENSTDTGLYHSSGTFTNSAKILVGAGSLVGVHGIFNEATFNNNAGGDIEIDRASGSGLRNFQHTFTNAGLIKIGSYGPTGTYGIRNHATFLNNAGGQINVLWTQNGIYPNSGVFDNAGTILTALPDKVPQFVTGGLGVLNNNTGGVLAGTGTIASAALVHAGGTLSPGYSPGTLTFDASEDFAGSTMAIEVNGVGTPGIHFDRIVVNGTATLGGTLAATVNYAPAIGDEIIVLTATAVTGTFSAATGLAVGWKVVYESNAVKLRYDDPMPVTLVSFNARAESSIVRLEWRTTSETNNAGFYIERSSNGFNWEDIGFVDGNATTSDLKDYAFRDEMPLAGLNYYRLRQTDFDGTTERSRVAAVRFADPQHSVTVSTNAARQVHVKSSDPIGQVTVYDLSGRVILISKQSILNLPQAATGIVLVRVTTAGGTVVRKVVLF
jgi:hypothetical protein